MAGYVALGLLLVLLWLLSYVMYWSVVMFGRFFPSSRVLDHVYVAVPLLLLLTAFLVFYLDPHHVPHYQGLRGFGESALAVGTIGAWPLLVVGAIRLKVAQSTAFQKRAAITSCAVAIAFLGLVIYQSITGLGLPRNLPSAALGGALYLATLLASVLTLLTETLFIRVLAWIAIISEVVAALVIYWTSGPLVWVFLDGKFSGSILVLISLAIALITPRRRQRLARL